MVGHGAWVTSACMHVRLASRWGLKRNRQCLVPKTLKGRAKCLARWKSGRNSPLLALLKSGGCLLLILLAGREINKRTTNAQLVLARQPHWGKFVKGPSTGLALVITSLRCQPSRAKLKQSDMAYNSFLLIDNCCVMNWDDGMNWMLCSLPRCPDWAARWQ
jgi:hypothetical protein